MSELTVENKIIDLENAVKILQKQCQVLTDIQEISNLMGRHIYLHELRRDAEFVDTIYSQNEPDVSVEVANSGVYVGKNGLRKLFGSIGDKSHVPDLTGRLVVHTLTTPVIEISKDGRTAKGIWISPGVETIRSSENNGLVACWAYTKYAVDFIKEECKWRFWHYHIYRIFMTPYNHPWTDEWESNRSNSSPVLESLKPDIPTTYDNPYTCKYIPELVPAPPEPYETFSETFSYGPK